MKTLCIVTLLSFVCTLTYAQDNDQEQKEMSNEELAKKALNPVANMYSVPLQNNITFGVGPDNRTSNTLNIQPVIPIDLGKKLLLISRAIIPIKTVPDYSVTDSKSSVTGLGDTSWSLFLTPQKPGKLIWGIGPVFQLPTSTNEILGAGAWGVGPSILILTIKGKWMYGFTANQTWSLGNNKTNLFYTQYFINYTFPSSFFVSVQPIITSNWNAEKGEEWMVPFGTNVGKIVRIGKQPINLQAGVYYNAIKPENAGDWQLRLLVNMLFPRK